MTLEELIYKRIAESAAAEQLASHNGAPAVFFGPAPTDTDPGWAGAEQYPPSARPPGIFTLMFGAWTVGPRRRP